MVEKSKEKSQINSFSRPISNLITNGPLRNYSTIVSNSNDQILSKLEQLQNDINEKHTDLVSKIEYLTETNSELRAEIKKINARQDETNKAFTDNNNR